jgi:hypothetical protein
MDYQPHAAAVGRRLSSRAPTRQPRRGYRQKLSSLVYVNLDHVNAGVLRDVSEIGLGMQAMAPVLVNQQIQLRFELGPRLHLELLGRVAWIGTHGNAGVEFLSPSDRSRRLLRQWIFIQLLARAHHLASMDSIFSSGHQPDEAPELRFSEAPRQPIKLDANDLLDELEDGEVQLGWLPISVSSPNLARLVDGLALIVAVLLFCVVSLAMIQVVPSWPVAVLLAIGAAGLLTCLYWLLFSFSMGGTPGARLASLCKKSAQDREDPEQPRFR